MAELDLMRAVADVDGTPAAHCGLALRILRRDGYPFDEAWTAMKRVMERGSTDETRYQITEWKRMLEGQRDIWRDAYHRVVSPGAVASLDDAMAPLLEAFDLATGN